MQMVDSIRTWLPGSPRSQVENSIVGAVSQIRHKVSKVLDRTTGSIFIFIWATSWKHLYSGVCDQVRLKPACSATEASSGFSKYRYYTIRAANNNGADQTVRMP